MKMTTPSNLLISCDLCNAGSSNYGTWMVHLTTEQHQMKVQQSLIQGAVTLHDPKVRDKAVIVSNIPVSVPLKEIVKYFSRWGFMKEFIYVGATSLTMMECVVVYNSEGPAEEVLYETHFIDGHRIVVQRQQMESEIEVQDDDFKIGIGQSVKASTGGSTGSSVRLDLSEFTTSEKKKFENKNEYQKIALQMKDDLKEEDSSNLKLVEQVDSFCQLFCLTEEQMKKRSNLGNELTLILYDYFPNCGLYPFGHDYIGIATDIDTMNICIDVYGKMSKKPVMNSADLPPCSSKLITIIDVFKILKNEEYNLRFCRDVQIKCRPWVYTDHEIQQITFVHCESGVVCNLVMENFIVIYENRLAKFLLSLDPRIHPLLCYVRLFAAVYDTFPSPDEAFKNQSMIWLLLSYLSSKKIIPLVEELKSLSDAPLTVGNYDNPFSMDLKKIKHTKNPMMEDAPIRALSALSLLHEFFSFYAEADLKNNVVCSDMGEFIPVEEFKKFVQPSKIVNEDGSTTLRRFYTGSPMAVQNPLDSTTNLTKNVSLTEVVRFQKLCRWASLKLEEILQSVSGDVMDIFIIQGGKENFVPMELDHEETSSESESSDEEVEIVPPEEFKPKEVECWDLDTESEDDTSEDFYLEIRQSRIRLSQSLRRFFERAIATDRSIGAVDENINQTSDIQNLSLSIQDGNASVSDPSIKAAEEPILELSEFDSRSMEIISHQSESIEDCCKAAIEDLLTKIDEEFSALPSTPMESEAVQNPSNPSLTDAEVIKPPASDVSNKMNEETTPQHCTILECINVHQNSDPSLMDVESSKLDPTIIINEDSSTLKSTTIESDTVKNLPNQSLTDIEGSKAAIEDPEITIKEETSILQSTPMESDTAQNPSKLSLADVEGSKEPVSDISNKNEESSPQKSAILERNNNVQILSYLSMHVEAVEGSNEPMEIQLVKTDNEIIASSSLLLDANVSDEKLPNGLSEKQTETFNQLHSTKKKKKSGRKKKRKVAVAVGETKSVREMINELETKCPLTNGQNKHIFFDEEDMEIVIEHKQRDPCPPPDKKKSQVLDSVKAQIAAAAEAEKQRHNAQMLTIRKKFQALWLQFLIEFNSRFWTECFGFYVETYADQVVTPADYSKTDDSTAGLTLKEKFDSVNTDEESCPIIRFRCETRDKISNLLYKKKIWSKRYLTAQIRPLWLVVSGKATSKCTKSNCSEIVQTVKEMVRLPFDRRFEFSCSIDTNFDLREGEDIPKNGNLGTSAKLSITDETYGRGKLMRTRKMRFLATIYERLSVKYINLRFKQWLATSQDIDYNKIAVEHKIDKKKAKGPPKWRKFRRRERLRLEALKGLKSNA